MSSGEQSRRDFFVSYTSSDLAWAEWIAWTLEEAGYSVFLQAWDFTPGAHFIEEMHRATSAAERTIAVLSEDYIRSEFATAEWQEAWRTDPRGLNRALLVVRIEDCDCPGLLGQVVSVDLFGIDMETARSRLLNAVRSERQKPPMPPDFPGAEPPTLPPPFPGRLVPGSREEAFAAGGPMDRDNPYAVAFMWLYAVLQQDEELLLSTVTPESIGWWDLPSIRARTADCSLATGVVKPVYDVAYVRLLEGLPLTPEGEAWQVIGGEIFTNAMVISLVLRPELNGWRVHGMGYPVAPDDLPRTWNGTTRPHRTDDGNPVV